ncbi:phage replisome organizer N-terminal domain-containing protein [Clostridium perfringens]
MSDNKKYYYLKLKENFFDSAEIKVLESMPNGYKYSNLLLKLYLKALKFNGKLRLNEFIPYNHQMIAAVTGIDIDTVKVAFDLFEQLKLIEVMDDGTIYMLEIQNFIGKSSTEADRIRAYRNEIDNNKKKALKEAGQTCPQDSVQMYDKSTPELELELELEKELEIDYSYSEAREKEVAEIMKFCQKNQYKLKKSDANQLIETYGSNTLKKAIVTTVSTKAFEEGKINGKNSYLIKVLNDLSSEQKKIVNIKYEKREQSKANFTERDDYDYDALENGLSGIGDKVPDSSSINEFLSKYREE